MKGKNDTSARAPSWNFYSLFNEGIADYYNCNVDAELAQKEVEKIASDLVKAIGRQGGVKHGVGAYEPTVPGEMTGRVVLEVE